MPKPNRLPLTYLAQVRQPHLKSEWLYLFHVFTMHPFLLMKRRKKHGTSHKEIAIIGIVHDAVWVVQNRSTGVWLKVAGNWQKTSRFILSRSLAEEKR